MAAPRNAYKNKPFVLDGKNCLVGVPTVTKEILKARFHLDDILVIQKDGENNALEFCGIIGACKIGSPNYLMHNPARYFYLRGYDDYVFFNDAGFNVKGTAFDLAFTNLEVGSIAFTGTFKSSFFNDSIDTGFIYTSGGMADVYAKKGYLAQNSTRTSNHALNPLSLIQAGETLTLRGFVENSEGIFESVAITGVAQQKTISAMFTTGWPSGANNPVVVYVASGHTYTAIYLDAALNDKASDGYYVFDGQWYKQEGGVIVAQGLAQSGSWPTGDPDNPSVQKNDYYGYSPVSRAAAVDDVEFYVKGTLYRNSSNSLWYTSYDSLTGNFSGLVPYGFYAAENGSMTWGYDNGVLKSPMWNG